MQQAAVGYKMTISGLEQAVSAKFKGQMTPNPKGMLRKKKKKIRKASRDPMAIQKGALGKSGGGVLNHYNITL